jgi:DNA polymerase-3 subunit epsilon
MGILFFDTETTGLPVWNEPSEGENQPHIVQLAAILVDPATREEREHMDVIIRPDGWVIPDEVAAIHGITTERAMDEGIEESVALDMFLSLWAPDRVRVGHNQSFDERILRIAIKRYKDEALAEQWKLGIKACTGLLSKPICQMLPKNRYGFKMPKLQEAYKFFTGAEFEDAHSAMADARACMSVYWAVMDHQSTGAKTAQESA